MFSGLVKRNMKLVKGNIKILCFFLKKVFEVFKVFFINIIMEIVVVIIEMR